MFRLVLKLPEPGLEMGSGFKMVRLEVQFGQVDPHGPECFPERGFEVGCSDQAGSVRGSPNHSGAGKDDENLQLIAVQLG